MRLASISLATSITALIVISLSSKAVGMGSACSDEFIKMERKQLRALCGKLGVELKEQFVWSPYDCSTPEARSDWSAAKRDVDWVIADEGARRTYEDALQEFSSTRCIPLGEDKGMLMAILHAQAHNAKAQCYIWQCHYNINITNGYIRTLIDQGKLREPK